MTGSVRPKGDACSIPFLLVVDGTIAALSSSNRWTGVKLQPVNASERHFCNRDLARGAQIPTRPSKDLASIRSYLSGRIAVNAPLIPFMMAV